MVVPVCILLLPLLAATVNTKSGKVVEAPEVGKPVSVDCTLTYEGKVLTPSYWHLVDGTRITASDTDSYAQVVNNGQSLYIASVELSHLGEYSCFGRIPDGNITSQSVELKLTLQPLWTVYKWNVIIGLVAGLVTLIILVAIYLIYRYRWERRKGLLDEEEDGHHGDHSGKNAGHNFHAEKNAALHATLQNHGIEGYTNEICDTGDEIYEDDDVTLHSTKM